MLYPIFLGGDEMAESATMSPRPFTQRSPTQVVIISPSTSPPVVTPSSSQDTTASPQPVFLNRYLLSN